MLLLETKVKPVPPNKTALSVNNLSGPYSELMVNVRYMQKQYQKISSNTSAAIKAKRARKI